MLYVLADNIWLKDCRFQKSEKHIHYTLLNYINSDFK